MELDYYDIQILDILQENCKTSYSNIASELDAPESTVRYRIERLEKRGIITGYIALVNPGKVGLSIIAIMLIKVNPQEIREISSKLTEFQEMRHLFRSTGIFDLISVINARDISHLNELMERVKLIQGVREVLIEVATELIKVDPKISLRK